MYSGEREDEFPCLKMVPHSRKYFLFKDICSSGRRDGVVVVQHLLHHEKTRVSLVVAGDTETKLLVDVDRRLEAFIGDDILMPGSSLPCCRS